MFWEESHSAPERREHDHLDESVFISPNTLDLYKNLKQMYVYCYVIEPQMVGSNALTLPRVIPVNASNQDQRQA